MRKKVDFKAGLLKKKIDFKTGLISSVIGLKKKLLAPIIGLKRAILSPIVNFKKNLWAKKTSLISKKKSFFRNLGGSSRPMSYGNRGAKSYMRWR